MSRSGAERISAHRNNHGFWRSGSSVLICCHGLERIPENVTERIGADIRSWKKVTDYHGADIRPLEMSPIGADWAIRSVIIRITDYISIRTHPCKTSNSASYEVYFKYTHYKKRNKAVGINLHHTHPTRYAATVSTLCPGFRT